METQAEFAERWIAEYRVRTARTADWLLSHPELPTRKDSENVQQRQANITKEEITLARTYEINWNHPRMREALRLYFYNNLRFDDTANLNQNEAPDDVDINPDFWNDVSQILKQLKYRDLSMNFGMAKYCPLFSSNDIDNVPTYYHSNQSGCGSIDQSPTFSTKDLRSKVTSHNAFDDLRAYGSVVRNPGLVYQHFAVQCGKGEDGNLISAMDFSRVTSRAKDSQDEFYHGCTVGKHVTHCSASNNGEVTFHKGTDSQAAYYHEFARGMHHNQFNNTPTERVASPDVTDSQAAFYHEYARRISHVQSTYADLDTRGLYREQIKASAIDRVTSPSIQDSQATYYHEYAKSMFQKPPMETLCQKESLALTKKNKTNKSKSGHYQELRHNGSDAKGSCLIKKNPLLRQLASHSVGFESPSVLVYIQTSQEIAWKKFPFETDFVMVNGRMIRDFSSKEIKREYKSHTNGEESLESLDVGLHVGGNRGSSVTEYSCQSHDSAGVKFTPIAADRKIFLKQNDKSIPKICDDTKMSAGSLCSDDSLEKAIREILFEDDLSNQCARHIRKDEMNDLEDVSTKVVGKNGKETDSKSKDRHKYTKDDNVHIAGGDAQTENQQEHMDSVREKEDATSQAQRKEVVNPPLTHNDVSEQTGTVYTNTQSTSTSLWSAGDFYKSVISREQEQLGCGLNDDLTPPKATQKICPMICSLPSQGNQVGQTSPCHKTTNNPDERMRDSHLLDTNSEDRELSRCPCAKTSIPELKPRQSNKLLRFIQRKAAHLKSKISSLSCRSSILHNK